MAYGTIAGAALMFVNVPLGLSMFTIVGAAVVNDFILILTKNFQDLFIINIITAGTAI